jgi:holo-[acyl-carrier protein] synthase
LNNEDGLNIAIGTDIVEIQRFRDLDPQFLFFRRVFTEQEREYCLSHSDPAPHFAATFAGKEAVVKATNSNCKAIVSTIEILRSDDGAPYVVLHKSCDHNIFVSLSHSSTHAVAVAIAVHKSYTSNIDEVQGILNQTVKEILPKGEVS